MHFIFQPQWQQFKITDCDDNNYFRINWKVEDWAQKNFILKWHLLLQHWPVIITGKTPATSYKQTPLFYSIRDISSDMSLTSTKIKYEI